MTVINVVQRTQKIIVDPSSSAVAIINQGPIGPAGGDPALPTAWTGVTFMNSWTNFGAGYQTMQYRKSGDVTELRGMVKGGTADAPVFILPVGFRPPATVEVGVIYSNGSVYIATMLRIYPTGEVSPRVSAAAIPIHVAFSTI